MQNRIQNFTDLDAWKIAHEFVIEIYKSTKIFPKEETYGLTSQLRRAASSITANISEGYSRYSYKDRVRIYYIARGSASECHNHILIARDVGYLSENESIKLIDMIIRAKQILNGFIRSTERLIP